MDERKKVQRNEAGIDTADQPAEGGTYADQPTNQQQTGNVAQTTVGGAELAPLFAQDATERFRARWLAIQSKFVDDPSDSVKQADQLVSDVIQEITRSFADRRGNLEKQWNGGEQASTEDLRIALKQYRSFFDRLLTLES